MDDCRECKQPLVEIDNRVKRLRGCTTCNVWHDNHGNLVRLSVEAARRKKKERAPAEADALND
jgi:hypothetical protein